MPEPDKILSQNEVDALLSAIDTGAGEGARDAGIESYDFRRPTRVPEEQVRFLRGLHEGYARTLQAALSGLLLRGVEARLTGVHQQPIRDVLDALPRPAVLALASAEPLAGRFLAALNPAIAYPMLERLMGARKVGVPQKERPLTALEWNVADALVARVFEALKEAWAPLGGPAFQVIRRETEASAIRFETPDEPSVSVSLELSMGEHRGGLELAFPASAIEPFLSKMISTTSFSGRRKDGSEAAGTAMSSGLGPASVELEVRLPAERISLGELSRLRPGDLLATNHPASAPLLVMVEGKPKFLGRLGRLKDRKAIRVLSEAPSNEPGLVPGAQPRVSRIPGESGGAEGLEDPVKSLPLPAAVVLARKTVKLSEALALRPGDLVGFPVSVEAPLQLRVAGRGVAEGVAVSRGGRFALQITALAGPGA